MKRKNSLVWLGVAVICVALLGTACSKPEYEMKLAQEMINDAKSAGAANKPEAASNLSNAERLLREGQGKMKKYDYATAKSKFDQAYKAAKKAYELAVVESCPPPSCCADTGDKLHVVSKGECLWKIAAKPEYYNDPFLWPLIYDRNKAEIDSRASRSGLPRRTDGCIKNGWAHWIFPGQQLWIPMNPTQSDRCAAARCAGKTRNNPYCP